MICTLKLVRELCRISILMRHGDGRRLEQLRDIVFLRLKRLQKSPKLLKSFVGYPVLTYISG